MKMVKAVIRPEKEAEVVNALEQRGFYSLTKVDVLGRGRQKGIRLHGAAYTELPKLMLILVVEDADAAAVVETIHASAQTGNFGDGKIFVSEVAEAYTIRTGEARL